MPFCSGPFRIGRRNSWRCCGPRIRPQNLREGRSALWDVEQWRSQSQSFADMATFDAVSRTLTGADGAEQIVGASISPNLLSLLGVQPVAGTQLFDRRSRAAATAGPDQSSLLAGAIREARTMRSARPSCSTAFLPRSSASSLLISRSRGSMQTCGSRTRPARASAAQRDVVRRWTASTGRDVRRRPRRR